MLGGPRYFFSLSVFPTLLHPSPTLEYKIHEGRDFVCLLIDVYLVSRILPGT